MYGGWYQRRGHRRVDGCSLLVFSFLWLLISQSWRRDLAWFKAIALELPGLVACVSACNRQTVREEDFHAA